MLIRHALLLCAMVLGLWTNLAWSQGNKTLRFVVGYPPGGSGDFVTRTVGEAIAAELGITALIDNRPGAAGNLATEVVVKSNDGATLLVASNPYINKALYKKLNYDVDKDSVVRGVRGVHWGASCGPRPAWLRPANQACLDPRGLDAPACHWS